MAAGFLVMLADMANVPIQQMIFPFLQLCLILFALAYRHILRPSKVGPTTRHIVTIITGLVLGFFCYSWSMLHLLLHATLGFVLMKFCYRKYMALVVFCVAMTYLSIEHLRKTATSTAVLLDHETPMMVMTMKITSLAYSLHDGSCEDNSKQHPKCRQVAIKRVPSVIEYCSYTFNFQTFMVGPFNYFTDYIAYVEGKHLVPYKTTSKEGKEVIVCTEPPFLNALYRKILLCIVMAITVGAFGPKYPISGNISDDVINSSPLYRLMYLSFSMCLVGFKYTFGFTSADCVCNASGLGFNGYDANGKPKWDLVTPINFGKFMTAIDMNDSVAIWNITTLRWLKHVCYYRVPFYKDKVTVLLSAIWHGFYPGYYLSLIVNLMLGTLMSKRIHHYFDRFPIFKTPTGKSVYFITQLIFNTIFLYYLALPFQLASCHAIFKYYSSVYYCGHIVVVSLLLVLPPVRRTKNISNTSNTTTAENNMSADLSAKKNE